MVVCHASLDPLLEWFRCGVQLVGVCATGLLADAGCLAQWRATRHGGLQRDGRGRPLLSAGKLAILFAGPRAILVGLFAQHRRGPLRSQCRPCPGAAGLAGSLESLSSALVCPGRALELGGVIFVADGTAVSGRRSLRARPGAGAAGGRRGRVAQGHPVSGVAAAAPCGVAALGAGR